jgi:hypothetical protein
LGLRIVPSGLLGCSIQVVGKRKRGGEVSCSIQMFFGKGVLSRLPEVGGVGDGCSSSCLKWRFVPSRWLGGVGGWGGVHLDNSGVSACSCSSIFAS